MKSIFTVFISAAFFLFFTAQAQEAQPSFDHTEAEIDRTSDDIERFIDDIVDHVETRIDDLVEGRNTNSRTSTIVEVQDQDKETPDAITFNGDTEIAENDTIHGDLVVKNGTLTIRGTVMGDVLVVNGDVQVKSTALVKGNVRSMNGSITKDEGCIVEGYTEESNKSYESRSSRSKRTSRAKYSYSFKPFMWYDKGYDDNFLFRYNRVEGFFFGFGDNKDYYWDGSKALSGHGSFGYGFASHKWRMLLGLDRQFATSSGLYEFGGEVHGLTDTKDEWIMKLGENNLAALFFHEDFRDYFQREGFSVHTARYTKDGDVTTMIDVRYNVDRYTSMDKRANWAVFGGHQFRSNPLINEGMLRSVSVAAGFNTVEKYRRRSEGWDAYTKAEVGGSSFGGDFDFTHAIVDLRRYQSLSDDDQLSARIRVGSLEGNTIMQRLFELGGANTMPAYGFKEFVGNRMILGNLEYQMSGELIDEIFFWPDFFNVILFADAGAVANVATKQAVYEGFDAISTSTVKSDLGFALSWHDGNARLGFAWRTDKSAPVAVFFRLNRAF
ncbi:MAG: BamA/TamA family outer membrane protein [Ignavibacteriales bacterium]|nr:BamA/TamA family outer membrane protein [Ignavibacteriales bacterium]